MRQVLMAIALCVAIVAAGCHSGDDKPQVERPQSRDEIVLQLRRDARRLAESFGFQKGAIEADRRNGRISQEEADKQLRLLAIDTKAAIEDLKTQARRDLVLLKDH
jgi:hypothetical protein